MKFRFSHRKPDPTAVQMLKAFALTTGFVWPASWKLEMARALTNLPNLPRLDARSMLEFVSKFDANNVLSSVRDNTALRDAVAQVSQRLEANPIWVLGALVAFAIAWYSRQRKQQQQSLTSNGRVVGFSMRLTLLNPLERPTSPERFWEWAQALNLALARQRSCVLWARFLS